MKRNDQKKSRRRRRILQLWTHAQARQALPYIASIVASVREHRLEAQQYDLEVQRLAARPGRPNRDAIIAHQDAVRDAAAANEKFLDDVTELQGLDIYCLDPVRGLAMIPTVNDNQLAWFMFDLFDENPLQSWRYHGDPQETRRPVTELATGITEGPLVI